MKKDINEKSIVDKEEYAKYLKIIESYEFTNTSILLKDGSFIDITRPVPQIKNQLLTKCDEDEISEILKKSKRWHSINLLSISHLNKARGHFKEGGNGLKSKYNKETKKSKVGDFQTELSYENQVVIIELTSKFFSVSEIMKVFIEDFKITSITEKDVIGVRESNIAAIRLKQEEFKVDISSVRLGYKRSRLEELSDLFARAKRNFLTLNKTEDGRFCKELLESIRKEIEGDKLIIDGGIAIEVNQHIEHYVKTELVHQAPLREIILSRICKATGITYNRLISELNKSPYVNETGLTRPISNEKFGGYISEQNYDFNEIQNNRIEIEKENIALDLIDKTEQITVSVGNNIQNKILKMIEEKKKAAEQMKKDLKDIEDGKSR